ncbi:MAG: leucine--tRNA ligase [Thermoguttaceae bacterium]|nr:leucine--tRNA ligase [Thermoguttaceae bacterium]MDW8078066.1 leucine--tRNA ligase [Thermoguttaceae bacterium]
MPRYNPAVIEPKWQRYWEENKVFKTPRLPTGPKMYILDMFPYPSGEGLHVGHPEGYTATDIVARFERMRGKCVMHPMGWDAFGLPAEQHAKRTGEHPRIATERNIATFRRQLKMLGFSYDWDRELATTDPEYFRWTQYIFLVLFDTWFDPVQQRGRPISELPIPDEIRAQGEEAVRRYQDEHRLAYQLEAPVNWCPALGTVLANEEVVGGVSERGGHPVVRIPLRQWMLRITAYADRLEKDLDLLDWPENIKTLQRNWIGRSTGAEVDFFIGTERWPDGKPPRQAYEAWLAERAKRGYPRKPGPDVLRIYTTRPDTLFGATYMVIAPEHPLVDRLTQPQFAEAVASYREQAARKSDLDRTDLAREKTGVFTGSFAINPVNGEAIPIWVADYVLATYGTGAIMAVPAHDTRDFEFAVKFRLPIVPVVDPGDQPEVDRQAVLEGRACFTGDGTAIASGKFTGLSTAEFKKAITEDLSARGLGRFAVNYRLRDWVFSRQHFWGEPFPILHELDDNGNPTGLVRALDPKDLPLDLPANMEFDIHHDKPEPPLEKAPPEWLYVTIDGKRYKRETNTMPQWAGSCWYYLRFLDPRNDQAMVDPEVERAWMPVDLYVGGAEHAVLHLLYARFWHKVLYDRGLVSTPEPFMKLVNQGMILGEVEYTGYQDAEGHWVSYDIVEDNPADYRPIKLTADQVEKRGDIFVLKTDPTIRIEARAYKMSKSRGNVINPDQIVADYGADTLRLYEMFMGPLEAVKPWSMEGVNGVRNFLDRVWRMIIDERAEEMRLHPAVQDVEPTDAQNRVLHRTVKAVTDDIQEMAFNTAIARMMEFVNFFLKEEVRPKKAMETFVLILSPFAPHICEELWQALGHSKTLAYEPWPAYDEKYIREEEIEIPVQINGKLRGRIMVRAEADSAAIETAARTCPRIAQLLEGKTIRRVIVVPKRMINFVVE